MNDLYKSLYEQNIITKEEYEMKVNESKKLSLESEKLISSIKSIDEFKKDQKQKALIRESEILNNIEQNLSSTVFMRYFKKNSKKVISRLNKLTDNSIQMGKGIKELKRNNDLIIKLIEMQKINEDEKINTILDKIRDLSENERAIIEYYINQNEFKELL